MLLLALLALPLSLGFAANAAAAAHGTISGKVTDAVSKVGIEGIEVCAYAVAPESESYGCAKTVAGGEYAVPGLATGEYEVEFASPTNSALDYVTQYYNGKARFSEAERVSVTSGLSTEGIDAQLSLGGRIAGRVSSASTGAGLEALVCVLLVGSAEPAGCTVAQPSGEYITPPLAGGEYVVRFLGESGFTGQYYSGKSKLAEANPVLVTVPNTTSGIDAVLQLTILPAPPANSTPPAVSGVPTAGATLSCANGLWSGTPAPTFTYKWLRDGAPIAGATESSYKIQGADEGHTLSCEVTAKNSKGEKSALSSGLAVPAPAPVPAPPSPVATVLASKLLLAGKSLPVRIKCSGAPCHGTIELNVQILVKRHRGRRTISTRETLLLAKAAFSLPPGKSATVRLHLTAIGRRRLAHAKHHPLAGKLVLALQGAKTTTKSVLTS